MITNGNNNDIAPLLRTARKLRKSLHPVAPSPAFRAHLKEELLQTAMSLPRYRGSLTPIFVEDAGSHPNIYAWSGFLLGLGTILLILLFLWPRGGRMRSGKSQASFKI